MAKEHIPSTPKRFRPLYYTLLFSSLTLIYFFSHTTPIKATIATTPLINPSSPTINILTFPSPLNQLSFSPNPPPRSLKFAVFVKRWPSPSLAGGLERHALTLHLALSRRGHHVHVFTTNSSVPHFRPNPPFLTFHPTPPSPAGALDQPLVWSEFVAENASRPFDLVHSESVGLFHARARALPRITAVSWHGFAYEAIHSDVVQDLLREPGGPRSPSFPARLARVVDEVKFFPDYAHHVATSDHAGDVLRRVYMLPEGRVHVILNGADEELYKPGRRARRFPVPEGAELVIGMAGRLVKDKGHPLVFQSLKQLLNDSARFRQTVFFLVAGDGPWASRYRALGRNLILAGPLKQTELAEFYNSLDVLLNPTLRAQGLDHTFIEAMLCGVPVMGTRFASITGSVIVGPEVGYAFRPTVESVKKAILEVWKDGRDALRRKGTAARERALRLFTAKKMSAAYERLFLCIADERYCSFPLLPGDDPLPSTPIPLIKY